METRSRSERSADSRALILDAAVACLVSDGYAGASTLAADPGIGDHLRTAASVDGALATCDVIGGTAPVRVAAALRAARERLDAS